MKRDSTIKVLCALAKSFDHNGRPIPLNKCEIQDKAGIAGRQTVLNVVRSLEKRKWVDFEKREWRKNRKTAYYFLTEEGRKHAAILDPQTEKDMCKLLGLTEEEFHKRFQPLDFELTMKLIHSIWRNAKRGKAPKNMHYRMDIATDDTGSSVHVRFQIRRKDELNRMPFSELT